MSAFSQCREPVRNDEHRQPIAQTFDPLHYGVFRRAIKCARGFVKHDHVGSLVERARNADALALQDGSRQALYARLKLAGLDEAPAHVAAFADHGDTQGHGLGRGTMPEAVDHSVAIAVHTLWLAARLEGIGLGWVSILDPAEVTRILDVPPHWRLIGYLCLGRPMQEDDCPALQRAGWEERRGAGCRIVRR